jgi:hypothetical protein
VYLLSSGTYKCAAAVDTVMQGNGGASLEHSFKRDDEVINIDVNYISIHQSLLNM